MLGSIYLSASRYTLPPCSVTTATTRDVSAAATQVVKVFEFRQFCDSHKNDGKYGFTRSKISIYWETYMQPLALGLRTIDR